MLRRSQVRCRHRRRAMMMRSMVIDTISYTPMLHIQLNSHLHRVLYLVHIDKYQVEMEKCDLNNNCLF
jgi:hypothetical protein